MTYAYNSKLSPAVGGGLGGLPRRKEVDVESTGSYVPNFRRKSNLQIAESFIYPIGSGRHGKRAMAKLSDTRFVVATAGVASDGFILKVVDTDSNGAVLTAGQSNSFQASFGFSANILLMSISETTFLVIANYYNGADYTTSAGVYVVAGGAITLSTQINIITGSLSFLDLLVDCAEIAPNKWLLAAKGASSNSILAWTISWNGTALSAGSMSTPYNGVNGTPSTLSVCKSSDNVAVVVYTASSTVLPNAIVLTVTGSAIAASSSFALTGFDSHLNPCCQQLANGLIAVAMGVSKNGASVGNLAVYAVNSDGLQLLTTAGFGCASFPTYYVTLSMTELGDGFFCIYSHTNTAAIAWIASYNKEGVLTVDGGNAMLVSLALYGAFRPGTVIKLSDNVAILTTVGSSGGTITQPFRWR